MPFVDPMALGFATRLRNMKLLTGSIASGRYGLLTEKTRQELEGLDLRKFCEKDPDAMRDVVKVVVDVAERGLSTGISMPGPETPKTKDLKPMETPRTLGRTKRSSGNDMEGSPTPRKKQPVLVLPVATKTDDSEPSVFGKDSGWDGSIPDTLPHIDNELVSAGDPTGMVVPDLLDAKQKRRNRALMGRSSPPRSSASSSCSSVSPGFLEQLSARVNAIVARCPAPPPYSQEDAGGEEDEDNFDTPRQQRVVHGNYLNPKRTPGKPLFPGRIERDAKTDQFGGALKVPPSRQDGKPSDEFVERKHKRPEVAKRGSSPDRVQKDTAEREREGKSWITGGEPGIAPTPPFSSSAKGQILGPGAGETSTPRKGSSRDAEGAAYIPLPTSRAASTTSRQSKQGNDLLSRSPLPFPPSLLRTMHWATSLPTPPLSPTAQREQKIGSRLAAPIHSSGITLRTAPRSQLPKPRRIVTVTPLSRGTHKRRASGKRHSSGSRTAPVQGSKKIMVETPQGIQDDADEWVSIDSRELSLENTSKQATSIAPAQDGGNEMPLTPAETTLAPAEGEAISNDDLKDIHGHHWNDDDQHDGDDDDDDRTSMYSVSTVSWGEDDPFTAALRQKRKLAYEKLKAVERSFNDEIESKRRERMEGRDNSLADRLRWRTYSDGKEDGTGVIEGGESTDSEGGVTDVEEELRILEEIGKREAVRQGLLLKRLMERSA